jgi:glycerol-3-phosphate dehydrogenase
VDTKRAHLTIFGGKITDCLNVGEEVCDHLRALGIALPFADRVWYGEPPEPVREEYFHQARLMDLDGLTSPRSSEKLSTRLWRRYGAQALGLLENIRADPAMGEVLIEGAEYLRGEIEHAGRREMITRLSDFLRRRSKIELVVRRDELLRAQGLREACRILFGDAADAKLAEYLGQSDNPRAAAGT